MTGTPNLNLDHVVGSQANKETTINAALDALDKVINSGKLVTITGNYTVTLSDWNSAHLISLEGTPGSNFDLTFPSGTSRMFAVRNRTDADALVMIDGAPASAVTLKSGLSLIFYTGGVNLTYFGGTPLKLPKEVAFYVPGTPDNDEHVGRYLVVTPFYLPVSLVGSRARSSAACTGTLSWEIRHNNVAVGSINWAPGAQVATFTFSTLTEFAAGDRLDIYADPANTGETQDDIGVTLKGYHL